VIGAFAMADVNLSFSWRITGGIRLEKANIFSDVYAYDSAGYAVNDPRRKYDTDIFLVNPGTLNETNVLPSAGIIYNINRNPEHPFNVRLNYSKSVARPSIRELSESAVYDYEVKDIVFGNSDLEMVKINNYDLRIERYFESGLNLSSSLFYKDFKDHIELVRTSQGFTWQNVDQSSVYGVEFEGGATVFGNLDLQANVTLVKSETEFIAQNLIVTDGIKDYYPVDTVSRAMFGQAPYVVNVIAGYAFDSLGLALSVSYNIQGKKLVITSVNGNPDIYEMPRNQLDFKVSQRLGKHFSISLKLQNLLDEPFRRAYVFDDDSTIDYDYYKFGRTYTLGLTYSLTK
jgi:TonB-dependent receptor